jgi:plasmid stabilization system protein ParE
MDRMKVRWLAASLWQFDRASEYMAQDSPRTARQLSARIRKATERLKRVPESGRVGQLPGARRVLVAGLPFVVVYRVTRDALENLHVFHASQERSDPFHKRSRRHMERRA